MTFSLVGLTPLHVAIQSHGKPNPKPPSSSNGSREKPAGTSAQHASVIDSTRVIQVLIGRGANLEEVVSTPSVTLFPAAYGMNYFFVVELYCLSSRNMAVPRSSFEVPSSS